MLNSIVSGTVGSVINLSGTAIFVLLSLITLPRIAVQWYCVRKVYGYMPWTLAGQMWHYSKKSRIFYPAYIVAISAFVSVSSLLRELIRNDLPHEFILLTLAAMTWGLIKLAQVVIPPSILLLGATSDDIITDIKQLFRKLPRYRTLTLMDPVGFELSRFQHQFFFNCLRTTNHYQWRSIVFHLMDVVPIIVFDAQSDNTPVIEEIKRIEARGYLYKTIVVKDRQCDGLLNGTNPIHMVERNLLSQVVRDYFRDIEDAEPRKQAQSDFNKMTKAVPKGYRYPNTVNGFMVKAMIMMAYATKQFFSSCKESPYKEAAGMLLEDIPSRVSREDELAYFSKSRAIEEAEILINSAKEDLEKKPDKNNDFNLANVCNKLGQIARLKGHWPEAIRWLEEAINLLSPLTSGSRLKAEAQREIATSCFILGEVYMARFRDRNQDEDSRNAMDCFNRSIFYDHKIDGDATLAQERLNALNY